MGVNAGVFNCRGTVQNNTNSTPGTRGEITPTWATYASTWFSLERLSGMEAINARQLDPKATSKITMPYRSGVTTKMRMLFGSRALNFVAVDNVGERGEVLEILCTEVAA